MQAGGHRFDPGTLHPPRTPLSEIDHIVSLDLGGSNNIASLYPEEAKFRRFRVLDIVAFEEEDESPFVGLLQVEAV